MMKVLSAMALGTLLSAQVSAAIVHKNVEYKDGGKTFEGYLAFDDSVSGKRPGILVTHDWMGITDRTQAVVDRLAGLGYVAFAADVYGKGVRPANKDDAGKLAGSFKSDRKLLRKNMTLALKTLLKQPQTESKKVAVTGYCFGGTSAIELARSGADLKAVVSFHGGLDSPTPADGKKIKARVLALHGADDPFEKPEDLKAFEDEMRAAKIDWQLVKYGNAVHSFTDKSSGTDNSKGAAYNAEADKRSWIAMQNFLSESFAE